MSKSVAGSIGSYRLQNIVNTSQHHQLWRAYHEARQSYYALKVLLNKFRDSREYIGYLKHEYKVGSSLTHERIIQVHEFGVHQGSAYIVMEWFSAPNLKVRIAQGWESLAPWAQTIAIQAAESLSALHAQGWVHRDVKPENFLVSDVGDLKLIDFSIAQKRKGFLGKLFSRKTKVQGTRSYIAPEQIRGEAVDDKADVYSLGCTLFELVTGRPPFTGASSNELLTKHLRASPPGPESVNPNVTAEFSSLVRCMMAKGPELRPSMKELVWRTRETSPFRQTA